MGVVYETLETDIVRRSERGGFDGVTASLGAGARADGRYRRRTGRSGRNPTADPNQTDFGWDDFRRRQ